MAQRSPYFVRVHEIRRVASKLRGEAFPRLQMLLLVALTGGFGLLSSFGLLQAGLDSMAIRYPVALALSYGFFLFLLWLWLRTNAADYIDVPDPSGLSRSGSAADGPAEFVGGGGGDFAGGGASASIEAPPLELGKGFGGLGTLGTVGDADELAIPLVVIVLAAGLAIASFYVVYIAPVLFAELLVDGALSYALFRHLRSKDRPYWVTSALRHTLVPFVVTGVFLAAVGGAMSLYAPGAKSVGQVVKHFQLERSAR
jgi:hypothetical protein